MSGVAIVIIIAAMAGSWLFRGLLLRTLRTRHPPEFAELGRPSYRQLASLFPRYREMQIRFWKYLWGGKVFLVDDRLVSGLAGAALLADVALAIGVALLLWSARG
jgi:hypoxanthine-guanine phosphoribosyltransferase